MENISFIQIFIVMDALINGKTYRAEYLTEPEDLQRGMMGRDSLDGCMVFKLNKGHHSFWMKGCNIILDIIFVLNNRITHIHNDCQPSGRSLNPPHYSGIGDHVVEFPGGTATNWKVGDKIYFVR